MRKNERLEKHIRRLGWLAKNAPTAKERRFFWELYQDAKAAASENEDMIEEIINMYVRNPAFPGDMVGWLHDDFDWDDEDDKDDKNTKQ